MKISDSVHTHPRISEPSSNPGDPSSVALVGSDDYKMAEEGVLDATDVATSCGALVGCGSLYGAYAFVCGGDGVCDHVFVERGGSGESEFVAESTVQGGGPRMMEIVQ